MVYTNFCVCNVTDDGSETEVPDGFQRTDEKVRIVVRVAALIEARFLIQREQCYELAIHSMGSSEERRKRC